MSVASAGRCTIRRRGTATEWTLHPDGAFTRGLIGAAAADVEKAARVHVEAMDPCAV